MSLLHSPSGAHSGAFWLLALLVVLAHGLVLSSLPLELLLSPAKPAPVGWISRQLSPQTDTTAVAPATTPDRQPRMPKLRKPGAPKAPPTGTASPSAAGVESPAPVNAAVDATAPITPPPAAVEPQSAAPEALPAPANEPPLSNERARPAAAVAVPASARLRYQVKGEVKGLSYSAHSELLWQQDGQHYEARLEVSAFLLGSRVQTSSGDLSIEGLAPIRFGDKTRSEQAAHFERAQGKVVFSANTPSVPLLPGAQDRLSLLLQLSALVAGNPAQYGSGTTISLQVVNARDAEVWLFTVGETEQLRLPGGELAGLRLTRKPRREFDQSVELWLAPAMDYLPVRLRITQSNGDFVDQQWRATEAP